MDALKKIVSRVMSEYAVKGLNGYSVLTSTPDEHFLTILSLAHVKGKRLTTTSLVVQIDADRVIIEQDINNKPLVDALMQAGIQRDKIILAYAGEPVPETV